MLSHQLSRDDEEFCRKFEAFEVPATQFDHQAHVRLAYVYLCRSNPELAAAQMKQSLLAFLQHLGVGTGKYHETITLAWVRAVNHFIQSTGPCASFAGFIAQIVRQSGPTGHQHEIGGMNENEEILKLLTEIRDNQKVSLERQEEHLAIAREQIDRSRNQVEKSIALQQQAVERFKKISRIALPAIILCIALILYLVVRFL